jgi:hypothetical protein
MVSGEHEVFFHISAKRGSRTSVARFSGILLDALAEMKQLLGPARAS